MTDDKTDIETLAQDGMKLLDVGVDSLYATLGGQLLVTKEPTQIAGIVCYLFSVKTTISAKALYGALPFELGEWVEGLGTIYEELKRGGIRYLTEVSGDLRSVLCNEEILRLSDEVDLSTMRLVITEVGFALKLPQELGPIWVTVAVILLKLGLREFCR